MFEELEECTLINKEDKAKPVGTISKEQYKEIYKTKQAIIAGNN